MAKMWGIFREYGPPAEIPENLYTMEIFHGGYFDKKLDGTWKDKVPRFNKLGGKIYLDGLDPELISWVEMNNIAHAPKGSTNLKDQVIRSRKTWKKIKQIVESTSGPNVGASTSQSNQQPPTQSSQNPAAGSAQWKESEPMQPSQASSEYAAF